MQRLAFVCLFFTSLTVFGQSRYISDDIPVTLRTGPSLQNRIVRSIGAGVRVEALEADEESGYTRVRLASDGTEGWVLTRYLTPQPIARDRLAAAERNLSAALSRVAELEAQVSALTGDLDLTRAKLQEAVTTNGQVTSELQSIRTASANAIELRDENETLRRRLAETDRRIDRLAMENTALASDTRQQWFMVGGGVLLAGFLIGLIVPRMRRRRRSDW